VDFFTPVVDDPYDFGAIAAANSLSDVYAMGGVPLTALGLLCAEPADLPPGTIEQIVRGGTDKLNEAGTLLVGGHSVRDPELKYGFAVMGTVHPDRAIPARGAQPGDVLFLTKPLGTGILSTALKNGALSRAHARTLTRSMSALNAEAARAMIAAGARAATDVTGFGLAGHALNMAGGVHRRHARAQTRGARLGRNGRAPRAASREQTSGVTLRMSAADLPLLPGVRRAALDQRFPGGLFANESYYGPFVRISDRVPPWLRAVVFDPQTSGGLLVAVPYARARRFERVAQHRAQSVWRVGEVEKADEATLVVE
jgi:selenide,water dikinase